MIPDTAFAMDLPEKIFAFAIKNMNGALGFIISLQCNYLF